MEERLKAVMLDFEYMRDAYFAFDAPVPYKLNDKEISIKPIILKDSMIFLTSCDLLTIDKNSIPSAEIISMSYLEFLFKHMITNEASLQKLINILVLCLDIKNPRITKNEIGKLYLLDPDLGIKITGNQFEDIRRIILHQNLPHYDDSYINPDLKKSMEEMDQLRNKDVEIPTLERKMAIITAHCGISKKAQMEMTLRSHTLLFEEVCGEVEFTTTRPIAMLSKESASKIDHWIYRRKKDKLDGYITDVETYHKSMGGDGNIRSNTGNSKGKIYDELYNEAIPRSK